jgi:pyruvate formate lyase activating enzyme
MKEAMLYTALEDKNVKCALCAHRCLIRPGKRGVCGVRENRDGVLYSLVYRKLIAQHIDPIEKKPLFHVLPGSLSYSIATVGCNFKCSFCQNADISQMPADMNRITGHDVAPEALVEDAAGNGCRSIAYTYTEPTIYFEYAYDTADTAEKSDLLNVFVSNGYMTGECLDTIGARLHAANVDLKSFRDEYYKSLCKAKLQPVLDTLEKMKEMGIWVEVTTLLIPG